MPIAPKVLDERGEPRLDVYLDAAIFFEGIGVPVTIKNISTHGVMLTGKHVPPVGTHVSVMTAQYVLRGTVQWIGEEQYGVLLDEPSHPRLRAPN
jgi:hypothetical protein